MRSAGEIWQLGLGARERHHEIGACIALRRQIEFARRLFDQVERHRSQRRK